MAGKPCKPNCQCAKHFRSLEHNEAIADSVRATFQRKGLKKTPRAIADRRNYELKRLG